MSSTRIIAIGCFLMILTASGCSDQNHQNGQSTTSQETKKIIDSKIPRKTVTDQPQSYGLQTKDMAESPSKSGQQEDNQQPDYQKNEDADQSQQQPNRKKNEVQIVAEPESIPVLVNKQNKLPDSYNPKDLTYTQIPFTFTEMTEKRKMRREAAYAIEQLFQDAVEQGIHLLGVSAYRSHSAQVALFHYYVNRDGYQEARTYSALPGTSEHETGLAIDVTGENGKCAAQDCFGQTKEAAWVQEHAFEYGFIIRYPKGKETITGYKYEPWHLRYVGKSIAKEIMTKGITLEEYNQPVPVNN